MVTIGLEDLFRFHMLDLGQNWQGLLKESQFFHVTFEKLHVKQEALSTGMFLKFIQLLIPTAIEKAWNIPGLFVCISYMQSSFVHCKASGAGQNWHAV